MSLSPQRLFTTAKSSSPVLLCADFDETITLHDTLALLFQSACSPAATQQQLVTQYAHEVSVFLQRYEAAWQQRDADNGGSQRSSFDGAGLREFLEGYAAVDLRSLRRVLECRALRGIRPQDVTRAVSDVPIRAGYAETLAAVDEWRVISANWSCALVQSVLLGAGVAGGDTRVIANELETDAQGVTTGEMRVRVQSPMDKAQWVGQLRVMCAEVQPTVVYVGDSTNDLLAMLEADVGVWLAADTKTSSATLLRRLVENYGIDVHPLTSCSSLGECVAKAVDDCDRRPVLFTMTDWSQLNSIVGEQLRN